ncbi:DNA-directed RNA polymerase [Staphylothermus hellenicus]|uniref:DNA-directed RNA polymerase subunit Rpo7 n=1 Tax=Staphylothermus hellenicus (strain DSM 12710 / JCM 10830 / BK20S6-10-b1 / P8) TaxID=591019 RepID=D7DAC3_STAHD|nr:DNA-directed RNA polymerase [Staphylothermus hellenicus]ADI32719.1 DNA-directed RNA polymerase [Staphylothermus hellenicus DSM 12710]
MVYRLYRIRDVVRIPPEKFSKPLEEAAWEELRQTYEGMITKNLGIIVTVLDVNVDPQGKIIPGDGATYHKAEFTVLAFYPFIKEVVEGRINTVLAHGAFVDLGASDGFIYINQISDEKIDYDPTRPALILRESRRMLERGDAVRARVYNVAPLPGKGLRVQLTMRQPFLGKIEWIKKEIEKQKKS